jgi:hypothetical protein
LLEKGLKNVFVLEGGFHAWKRAGYPIEVGSIDKPVQIHLNRVSNSPDDIVSINVTLNANKKPVSIISLEIGFEPNLLTNPKASINLTIKRGTPTDRILSTNTSVEGILKLDFKPVSQTPASLNAVIPDGVIANVTFDVAPAAKTGTKVNLTITPDAMDSKKKSFNTKGRNTTIIIGSTEDALPQEITPILKDVKIEQLLEDVTRLHQEIEQILADFTRIDWNSRRSMSYDNLSDKAWKVRLKSEKRLIALGELALPMLATELSSENPHVRALVSLVLGIIGDKSVVSSLIARLQDEDETVRLYAAEALGRLGDASAQEALKKALEDKSSSVANYAKLALKRLKGEISTSKATETLTEQFLRTLDEAVWDTVQLNQAAPDFSLLDSTGKQINLTDYKGKNHVVLVFLLADW